MVTTVGTVIATTTPDEIPLLSSHNHRKQCHIYFHFSYNHIFSFFLTIIYFHFSYNHIFSSTGKHLPLLVVLAWSSSGGGESHRKRRRRRRRRRRSYREFIKGLRVCIQVPPKKAAWPHNNASLLLTTAWLVVPCALPQTVITIPRGKIWRALHHSIYVLDSCQGCHISFVMVITRGCCAFWCGGCINHTIN